MAEYLVVDADSHVEEVDETWSHMDESYRRRRPLAVTFDNRPEFCHHNALWLIDGVAHPQYMGRGTTVIATPLSMVYAAKKPFGLGSQGMTDPAARIRDLDKGRIHVQVIYPTIFLEPLTDDPGLEAALASSYNTWMAKACSYKPDRLKWAAVMPMQNVPKAVEEVRRAKELGAVSVVVFGTVRDRMLHDISLDPVFAEAERLKMPVGIHTGWSHPGLRLSVDSNYGAHVLSFTLPIMMAFFSILGEVLDRHPRLRVGFLEAGVDWVPYMVQRMDHYHKAEQRSGWPVPRRNASDYIKNCEIYFTCEAEEKLLPEVVNWIGEDRIMMEADMPHGEGRDTAVQEIQERRDIREATKRKILGMNAKAFYTLEV
ncbi:MAG: amidohydrolase family protein [Candidatus Binatia bacterium]